MTLLLKKGPLIVFVSPKEHKKSLQESGTAALLPAWHEQPLIIENVSNRIVGSPGVGVWWRHSSILQVSETSILLSIRKPLSVLASLNVLSEP